MADKLQPTTIVSIMLAGVLVGVIASKTQTPEVRSFETKILAPVLVFAGALGLTRQVI